MCVYTGLFILFYFSFFFLGGDSVMWHDIIIVWLWPDITSKQMFSPSLSQSSHNTT